MRIMDVMTRDVRVASPDETIEEAAKTMAELDIGALPVGDRDRLVGMVTDRDIAVRAVARGRGPDAKVSDVMTGEIRYCFEDEDCDHVARNMAEIRVRRLPVLNREKRLTGIVSIADFAVAADDHSVSTAVDGVSLPGGPHSQTAQG